MHRMFLFWCFPEPWNFAEIIGKNFEKKGNEEKTLRTVNKGMADTLNIERRHHLDA